MHLPTLNWHCRLCGAPHVGPLPPRCVLCGAPGAMFEPVGERLLDRVRRSCRWVARQARHVAIDRTRLVEYARNLPLEALAAPGHDPATHFLEGDTETTLAFFLTLNSINFGSGWFPHLTKRPGRSGYFTIAGGLADRFRTHGALSATALTALTPSACARIFGQDGANAEVMQLMAHFSQALGDLGRLLLRRFEGRFSSLVTAAAGSAERLASLLVQMPLYRDMAYYEGQPVLFLKRAQLTAADLALAFGRRPPGAFGDLDRLTLFADNLVPHVLRLDGLLRYVPQLAAAIDGGELLRSGSEAEVEIRACGLTVVEELVASLRREGLAVTAMELDWLLWNRGQQPFYKQSAPRHRARSTFY